ncbi:uncharacterized protein LY79DRAFT_563260, partial [Colletotrichum navitas]
MAIGGEGEGKPGPIAWANVAIFPGFVLFYFIFCSLSLSLSLSFSRVKLDLKSLESLNPSLPFYRNPLRGTLAPQGPWYGRIGIHRTPVPFASFVRQMVCRAGMGPGAGKMHVLGFYLWWLFFFFFSSSTLAEHV